MDRRQKAPVAPKAAGGNDRKSELVIITGLSGSGKGSVLKVLEDLGYYSVDNLPIDLIPKFADLTRDADTARLAALVVDIREGEGLKKFPAIFERVRRSIATKLVFMEAADDALMRRFSETRRPHPLGTGRSIEKSIKAERRQLAPIKALADLTINTSKFTVHELRDFINEKFGSDREESKIMIYITSFGFRHGVPPDSDLVFDVRFLPNPNYIAKFKHLTGRHPSVARYIRSFPQTQEFITRISELLTYLLPHYIQEGKSYLTIGFGCTGGHHRSVMIAEQIRKGLAAAGYKTKVTHRDTAKTV
ncbi:MAG: putative P-loop ATPase protein [Bryobacterales bacterium]|nr:putative P-loop ATPase protein [Bryobacterales bacterium]